MGVGCPRVPIRRACSGDWTDKEIAVDMRLCDVGFKTQVLLQDELYKVLCERTGGISEVKGQQWGEVREEITSCDDRREAFCSSESSR